MHLNYPSEMVKGSFCVEEKCGINVNYKLNFDFLLPFDFWWKWEFLCAVRIYFYVAAVWNAIDEVCIQQATNIVIKKFPRFFNIKSTLSSKQHKLTSFYCCYAHLVAFHIFSVIVIIQIDYCYFTIFYYISAVDI